MKKDFITAKERIEPVVYEPVDFTDRLIVFMLLALFYFFGFISGAVWGAIYS